MSPLAILHAYVSWQDDADLDMLLTSKLHVYPVCFLCTREDVDLDHAVALFMLLFLLEDMSIALTLLAKYWPTMTARCHAVGAFNTIGFSWITSPASTELETV